VWSPATGGPKSDIGDLAVLDPNANPALLQALAPEVIMAGLNISRSFDEPFRNFHDQDASAMDFKLRAAFTGTPYWGAYMTDVVKNVEMVKSKDLLKYLRSNPNVMAAQMDIFREEVHDLGCAEPLILAFGVAAFNLLRQHLAPGEYGALVRLTHYSHYISQSKYREEVLAKLASSGVAPTPRGAD
jgi:hypothetical protein